MRHLIKQDGVLQSLKNTQTSENMSSSNREQWSSMLIFIQATTGAAVGLGNIWKFLYMLGNNGGSAFVILYLVCVLIIGIPVMIAELVMGITLFGGKRREMFMLQG